MKEQGRLQEANGGKLKSWPKVAIIVLNWNGWRDTIECLESLQWLIYPNYQIIVVDNGSWDDSLEKIKAWGEENLGIDHVLVEYTREIALEGGKEDQEELLEHVPSKSKMVLIRNEENLGFTGGNNVAIHYALQEKYPIDYVFLLNNDAKVETDCLTKLVDVAHKSNAGIVGATLIKETDKAMPSTVNVGLIRQFFAPIVRPELPPPAPENDFWPSLWVGGAAMLVRKDALTTVHSAKGYYLNSNLFMYIDELDFCVVADKLGYKTFLAKQAIVYHKSAQSIGGSQNPISYYYIGRNHILLANELLPLRWKVLFHPVNVLLCMVRVLKNVAEGRLNSSWGILCGLWDGYRGKTGKWKYHDREALKCRIPK